MRGRPWVVPCWPILFRRLATPARTRPNPARIWPSGSWIGVERTSELPTYQRDLNDAVARTDRPLTVEDARWVNKTLRNYYHRVVEHALPDVADLLLQLDDVQARRFEERFAKESAKIERETAKGSNPAREEKRTAKLVDQIKALRFRNPAGVTLKPRCAGSETPSGGTVTAGRSPRQNWTAPVDNFRLVSLKPRIANLRIAGR